MDNNLFISDGTIINNVEIHGHGNSSWGQPKKSYTLELGRAQSVLGLKKLQNMLLFQIFWTIH